MKLSLCMIAKDEATCIGAALQSVKGFVDEIIVIDTGSTDETPLIAKSFGAMVQISPWQNDFAYHRNEALALANGDWILFLDCDEQLLPLHLDTAKKTMQDAPSSCMAYYLTLTNIIDQVPVDSVPSLRLFRNHHDFSFEGTIHEQILPCIQSRYGLDAICTLPLTIHHFGYDAKLVDQTLKVQRNLELLLRITPKTGYIYTMIGDCYYKGNQLTDALTAYTLSLQLDNSLSAYYSLNLSLNYTSCLILLNQHEKAWHFLQQALVRQPIFGDLYFLAFWILRHLHQPALARSYLDHYILLCSDPKSLLLKRFDKLYDLSKLKAALMSQLTH